MMSRSFGNTYSSPVQSTSLRMTTAAPGTEWEDLRKQARQHENEIDTKLTSFSKLCSNYVGHDAKDASSTYTSSSFEILTLEIEKLLERLSDINTRMADVLPSLHGSNIAATHTLQRHHEILQDYRREFERTQENLRKVKTREDLFNSNKTTNNDSAVTVNGLSSRRQDYYLREMSHLTNSHKLMDTNIEIASMVKKDLSDQRRYLLNISTKVTTLAGRFPLINNVLQKVLVKKRKDSLVLGVVIGICLLILLLYMFR